MLVMFIDIPTLLLCPNHGLMCRATLGTVPENLAHKPIFFTTPTSLSFYISITNYKKYFPLAGTVRMGYIVQGYA